MEQQYITSFSIIGISVRTTNEGGQMGIDIAALWGKFMADQLMLQIPGRAGDAIYCVYSGYEKDYMAPYTVTLGCRVSGSSDAVPAGMTRLDIVAGNYIEYTAKGNMMEGAVYNKWRQIWESEITRAYTTDFEIYGPGAENPEDAVVPVFIAV